MDFGTVRRKLATGQYRSFEQFEVSSQMAFMAKVVEYVFLNHEWELLFPKMLVCWLVEYVICYIAM